MLLFFVDAPYGGTYSASWGPSMPAKWGWLIMESPAVLAILGVFFTSPVLELPTTKGGVLRLILLLMWETHYVYRAWVYPFLQSGKDKPMSAHTHICRHTHKHLCCALTILSTCRAASVKSPSITDGARQV